MTKPQLFFATTRGVDGKTHSLACIVTHWSDEGSCVYERVSPDGKTCEAIENGTWRTSSGPDDEGSPSILVLEFPDNGEVDEAPLEDLKADLCRQGLADTYHLA
jgi:hypothetical protein